MGRKRDGYSTVVWLGANQHTVGWLQRSQIPPRLLDESENGEPDYPQGPGEAKAKETQNESHEWPAATEGYYNGAAGPEPQEAKLSQAQVLSSAP